MSFNLVEEPWIPVIRLDGVTDQVSLRDVFLQAHEIRRIDASLPTQSFALFRLLLAILHDAVGFHSRRDVERQLREGIAIPTIMAYLEELHDRFDLFDADRPFFQVATLRTAKDEVSGLEKIISDVPNGEPFLTVRAGRGLEMISAAEAAQWLVHCQAFDPSGIRSAAVGDPKTKGGKGYPIGPGWAGRIGGIVLHGKTLAETLAYNTVATKHNEADRPVWALAEPQTEQRILDAEPAGPVSVLTWQSRRIRLVGSREGVTGVVLAQGDQLREQNRHSVEFMTAWRYSKPQSKKFGGITVFMPKKHEPSAALWRGMSSIIGADREKSHDDQPAPPLPQVIAELTELDVPDTDADLTLLLESVGMNYGPQEATVADIAHDVMDFRLSLLGRNAAHIRTVVDDGIQTAHDCVYHVGRFARNVAAASGDFNGLDGAQQAATERAWAALDAPARAWIASIDANSSPAEIRSQWHKTLRRELQLVASEISHNASFGAISGRQTKFGYMTLDKAEIFLNANLRKALPETFLPSDSKESHDE